MAHVTFTYILLAKASDKVIHRMARRRDSKYLTTVFPPIWCHTVTKQYRAEWGRGARCTVLRGLGGKTSWRRQGVENTVRKGVAGPRTGGNGKG